MQTISKQLKKVRTAHDNLYQVDSYQRKSLVYEDPRRIQSIESYSNSLQHFNDLCKRETCFNRFNTTIFASTSVQLDLSTLTAAQKKFIDKEIQVFLCYISSQLREKEALFCIEWLIHKFRINEFNQEDLIRCILPYYETALFPKFIQVLYAKKLPQQWSWLADHVNTPISKGQFLKKLRKNATLLPFLGSSLLLMVDALKSEDHQKINDFCSLFTFSIVELLNNIKRPKMVANLVERIQGTILVGLKRSDCPPVQSAMKTLILKINEAIDINPDVIHAWIKLLFRFAPSGKALEHLKIALKLASKQGMLVLPEKLEHKRVELVNKLTPKETSAYQKQYEKAFESTKSLEDVPAEAMELCPEVRATTEMMEADAVPEQITQPEREPVNIKPSAKQLRKQIRKMSPEQLFGAPLWTKFQKSCSFRDLFHEMFAEQESDELMAKQRRIYLIRLMGESTDLAALDQALAYLIMLLLHDLGQVRLSALGVIVKICSSSKLLKMTKVFTSALVPGGVELLQSEDTKQMLNTESLAKLQTSLTGLANASLAVLGREDCEFSPECWLHAFQLISPATKITLFGSHNFIWTRFLVILKEAKTLEARRVLTFEFFHSLTLDHQKQLLTALLDGFLAELNGNEDGKGLEQFLLNSTTTMVEKFASPTEVILNLQLTAQHFTFALELLESRKHFQGAAKPLRSRLKDAREQRRNSLVASVDSYMPATMDYLRGLELIGRALESTIPQLYRQHMRSMETKEQLVTTADCLSRTPLAYTKLLVVQGKGSSSANNTSVSQAVEENLRKKIDHASTALGELIHPIVKQILMLTDEEKDPAYSRHGSAEAITTAEEDSDNGFESDEETGGGCVLPMSFLEMTPGVRIPMTPGSVLKTNSKVFGDAQKVRQRSALIKTCIHQLVGCLGQIFAQANLQRKEALAAATSQLKKTRHAYKLIQIANKTVNEGSIAKARLCIQPLFVCIEVFPPWQSLHQQILICLIELAAMFPLALCEHLMHFIRWVATSSHGRMMRLDDAHNLALIGRLVSVAVPSLVENSKQPSLVALDVLLTFVDNFPALVDCSSRRVSRQISRRRMALYCGVIHGLARACVPVNLANSLEEGTLRNEKQSREALQLMHVAALRVDRQSNKRMNALATWLWIATTFFTNRDWLEASTADTVSIFLVKMFNEFPLQTQVLSWCQCLAYLLYLVQQQQQQKPAMPKRQKLTETPHQPTRRSHRLRLTSVSQEKAMAVPATEDGQDVRYVPMNRRRRTNSVNEPENILQKNVVSPAGTGMATPPLMEVQNFCESECVRLTRMLSNQNAEDSSMDWLTSVEPATPLKHGKRHLVENTPPVVDVGKKSFWPLVSRMSQLLLAVLSSATHGKRIEQHLKDGSEIVSDMYGRLVHHALRLMAESARAENDCKETQSALQSSLVKIQECVRPTLYVRMLSELLERQTVQNPLNRRILELLAAKLGHLVNVTYSRKSTARRLDKTLEDTLLELLQRVHRILQQHQMDASSLTMRALLGCLVHLVQLLAMGYPQDCMLLVETVLMRPEIWWPSTDQSANGTHHAESRSLLCQFLSKSVHRLGFWLQPRWHVLGVSMLQIAADHSSTAARITDRPEMLKHLTKDQQFFTGNIHYRDQHLLAGLTLLYDVLRFSVVREFCLNQRSMGVVADQLQLCLDSPVDESLEILQFRPEALPMLQSGREKLFQLMSGNLLVLLCRLSSLDIVLATGCKPERSAVQLGQLNQLVLHLRHLLLQSPGVTQLIFSMYTLVKYGVQVSDWSLFHGIQRIICTLGDPLPPSFPVSPEEQSHPEKISSQSKLASVMGRKPELLYHLSQLMLTRGLGCSAVSTLMRNLPAQQDASTMLKKLSSWAQSSRFVGKHSCDLDADQNEAISHVGLIVDRLVAFLTVLNQLVPVELVASAEVAQFVELCRTAEMHIFLLDLLTLLTCCDKKKLFKMLGPDSPVKEFAILLVEQCPAPASTTRQEFSHPAKFQPEETKSLVVLLIKSLTIWLRAEHLEGDTSLTTLLSLTSGNPMGTDISQVAMSLVGVLDICRDPNEDNTPLVEDAIELIGPLIDAYLDLSLNDEALMKPLCVALCQRLLCSGPEAGGMHGVSHWRTRLASVQLLRKVYEHVLETDRLGQEALDAADREARAEQLASASCLVNDTLAGLQEALQDDRAEVEDAANKLFADLETSGVLSR